MNTHTNKTIIVLGATGGIGSALVKRFYEENYNIVISSRTLENLNALASEFDPSRILVVAGDATNKNDVINVFSEAQKRFEIIDAVVITTGEWERSGLDTPLDDLIEIAEKHFKVFFLPSLVVEGYASDFFQKQGHGLIANISSHAAIRPKLKNNFTYAAMKAAARSLTISLRDALKETKVRTTDIQPAIVNTPKAPLTDEQRPLAVQPKAIAQWIIDNIDNPDIPEEKLFDSPIVLD